MKKITLKISAFLLLTMLALQVQAQIVAGTVYNLRNLESNQYLYVADGTLDESSTIEYPLDDTGERGLNWTFFNLETDPANWTIKSSLRGILRSAGGGVDFRLIVTGFPADRDNGDKKFTLIPVLDAGNPGEMIYRFATPAGTSFIYEGDPATAIHPVITAIVPVTDLGSLWSVEESIIDDTEPPLSASDFDASSIFISNPVNNSLNIKGLTANVSKVSLYTLLGSTVLSKNVSGDSSLSIDVSALAAGMYIVKLEGENGNFSKKIIKQ